MAGDRGVEGGREEMFEGVERWTAAERSSRGRTSRSCRSCCEPAGFDGRPAGDAGVDLIAKREEMLVTAEKRRVWRSTPVECDA